MSEQFHVQRCSRNFKLLVFSGLDEKFFRKKLVSASQKRVVLELSSINTLYRAIIVICYIFKKSTVSSLESDTGIVQHFNECICNLT